MENLQDHSQNSHTTCLYVTAFLFTARGHEKLASLFPPYLQMSETQIANELLHGNLCGSQHFLFEHYLVQLLALLVQFGLQRHSTWNGCSTYENEVNLKTNQVRKRAVMQLENANLTDTRRSRQKHIKVQTLIHQSRRILKNSYLSKGKNPHTLHTNKLDKLETQGQLEFEQV